MYHIEIKNLTKQYINRRKKARKDERQARFGESVTVLDNINLNIRNGDLVCFMGPSGCGKSTLLQIIAGFMAPTSGQILINGRPQEKPGSETIFVFQENGLLPWMTVRENIGLGLRHMNAADEKEELIMEHIEMVELEGFENHYPGQLSGGMKRRAELARALVVNPEILIMDEPFSGLDFLTHMKMREEVVNMHQFIHKTTLMVTHDFNDALIMGDHIVIISGNPARVILEKTLDMGHPRSFEKNQALAELRDELFFMMGVSNAV